MLHDAGMRGTVLAVSVLIVLAGCGGSGGSDEATSKPTTAATPWSKAYTETTCTDWTDKMTQAQNQTIAGELLAVAWTTDGESARHPSKAIVTKFKSAITGECEADTSMGMTKAAASAYLSDKATFKP